MKLWSAVRYVNGSIDTWVSRRFRYTKEIDNLNPSNTTILQNARKPLIIPTYDKSNQVVHPSVIDFYTEHGLQQWGGYRFWMVATPYPYSNDFYENPCVYTSSDGVNWFVPHKIINPIDQAPGGLKMGFNNDPDMIYDPDADEIRVYFRFASRSHLKVKMVRVRANLTVSRPITVISQSPWTQSENTHRSLCIWRESSHQWHMWGGGGTEAPPHNIYYRFSRDGIHWEPPKKCVNDNGNDPFQDIGYTNWHFSCKPNYQKKRIEFLSYANPTISNSKGGLFYAECSMTTPFLIRTPIVEPILLPSERNWDNGTLYRATFCLDGSVNNYYRVWYSARSERGTWKLGYTGGYIHNARRDS